MSYGLAQLLELRPVTFQWKKDPEAGVQLGLIAQEVQKTVPEVVTKDSQSGMVNYTALLPIVIKGAQEQQKLLRDQQQRMKEQDDRIAALERARRPLMSSIFSSDLGQGTVVGGLALSISALLRRRRSTPG